MSATIDRVRALLEARLEEIEAEAQQLTSSLTSLGHKGSPRPQRKTPRTNRRMRGKGRARRGQRKDQFLAAVKKNPGATVAEVAKEIGVSVNQAYGLARQLQKDGAIKKSGKSYSIAPESR